MQSSTPLPTDTYEELVLGAALFDHSGLPREYFTTADNRDIGWVQTLFQALGLQSLLMSSLRLEGFDYAIAQGKGYFALVVRQRNYYLALLISQSNLLGDVPALVNWAHTLDLSFLRANPRFTKQ